MSRTMRNFSAAAAVLVAAACTASTATAQVTGTKAAPLSDAAQVVELAAAQTNTTPAEWVAVGDALVRASMLRAPGDPRGFRDLIGAANAYRVGGKLTVARRSALEAARRALRVGDAEHAAHAYLAAATVSADLRDDASFHDYVARARMLAEQQLTREQARPILAQTRGYVGVKP